MKKDRIVLCVAIVLVGISCSRIETQSGLKQSLERSTADINAAVGKITQSTGYHLLTLGNNSTAKSAEVFNDSITLSLISGIYDYQPDTTFHHHFNYPFRLFKRTGESDMMVVNLPERMIFHPKYLHNYNPTDSVLQNNFTISASEYHFYYNWWHNLDYKLTADLTLDNEDAGNLDISAVSNTYKDQTYSSKYTFTEGYNISTERQTGDTTISSFALSKEDETLLKETTVFIWNNNHKSERQYILTIGNVDLKRSSGIDSIQIFLDGVLQKEAAAFITDDADTTGSICNNRDILLTFDDGTTAKLSELIDPARTALWTLVDSLHNMYFAKNVVDYIAVSIYYNSRLVN